MRSDRHLPCLVLQLDSWLGCRWGWGKWMGGGSCVGIFFLFLKSSQPWLDCGRYLGVFSRTAQASSTCPWSPWFLCCAPVGLCGLVETAETAVLSSKRLCPAMGLSWHRLSVVWHLVWTGPHALQARVTSPCLVLVICPCGLSFHPLLLVKGPVDVVCRQSTKDQMTTAGLPVLPCATGCRWVPSTLVRVLLASHI